MVSRKRIPGNLEKRFGDKSHCHFLFSSSTTESISKRADGRKKPGRHYAVILDQASWGGHPLDSLDPTVVRHLFISRGHNFFGHHGQPAGTNPLMESAAVELIAGKGIRGDRFSSINRTTKDKSHSFLSRFFARFVRRFLFRPLPPESFAAM